MSGGEESVSKIKFCVFSDYHYWKTHYPNRIEPMGEIVEAAHAENVDFIIQCGDLCHNAPSAPELDIFLHNKYGIRALNCIGNHEVEDAESLKAVCLTYSMENNYEFYDINGFRIIVLDSNYYMDDAGVLRHQPPYTHSCENADRLGEVQLAWLEQTIATADKPCLLFSHATFESDLGSPDAAQVREIISKANARRGGSVLMCCNGHYHTNSISFAENVAYFNVNAVFNVCWAPKENPLLPEDFKKSARMAGNCCFTKEPLYAIVTVTGDGQITIKGRESEYLFGASPEEAGMVIPDDLGRGPEPRILSAEIQI